MDTVLSLKDVTKRIKGKMIIHGIDFSVKNGQIFGFLGPNGAGKTMTLRMIVGLIKPTSGIIEICGHNITTSFVSAMSNVGCIIETPELYEYMSGYDNLKLLGGMEPGINEPDIVDVVERVGLNRRIHDKVNTYSLGMKQRLGIAQALMKKPHLLILDEPANGLDPAGIRELRTLMKSLTVNSGMTILISSHLLSEIQMICDEVAIILHGKIIKTSAVNDLSLDQKVTWQVNDVDRTVLLLKNRFGLAGIDLTDHTVSAYVGDQMMQEINAAVIQSGIELDFVYKQQKSLEDLFMELTGGETIG